MTMVVTGWTGRGYDALGKQFIQTAFRHWPASVQISAYVDNDLPWEELSNLGNSFERPLRGDKLRECKGLAEFLARHRDSPAANGRKPGKNWKPAWIKAGYCFRWDAVRFAPQLFIPEAAAKHLNDGEILAWFDADCRTMKDVPEGFLESLMGDADCIYLGREPKWSEIGFWAVRLNPVTRWMLTKLATLYREDTVFGLAETHSAFVWDAVRRSAEDGSMKAKSLTPGGSGHVFPNSPLGPYVEHLKGDRKHAFMKRAA